MKNKMIKVSIDGMDLKVASGTTILEAARMLKIHIPTLCHHDDLCSAGICRICLVEIDGHKTLEASCCYPITEPITIKTHTGKVRQARRHIIDLLLSKHNGECYACARNENCELQSLAHEYGVESFKFGRVEIGHCPKDMSGISIKRDMNLCVLCRRCVRTCNQLQQIGVLETIKRGTHSEIAAFGNKHLSEVQCINCGQCINRCPTAALTATDVSDQIWDAIDDPEKHVVIQTAPSPRAGIGEEFGLEPGTPLTMEMNSALRAIGFDKVFDTTFSADLTILEEATELITRLYDAIVKERAVPLPQFTSCSPGWVKYIEHIYPEYLNNLSSCKSPQQMLGALIKTYYAQQNNIDPANIVVAALMPCTAKKYECNRPEMRDSGFKDVDYGITTREMAKMFRQTGIDLPSMPQQQFDNPFGTATGSGVIFGASGGVMEAALRTSLELILGIKVEDLYDHARIVPVRGFDGIKYAEIKIPDTVGEVPQLLKHIVPDWNWLKGITLKVGVAHGIANAKKVMEDIKAGGKFSSCHFIEFMACPGGCLGGGGQPIPTNSEIRKQRANAIYSEDESYEVRKSHENPAVVEVYKQFLNDGPCGHKSHQLLHTTYLKRSKYIC